jgi:hypothetical protein
MFPRANLISHLCCLAIWCNNFARSQPIAWSEWTWKFDKETEYAPPDNTAISSRHPQLNNRMRSVLFEWLGEVSIGTHVLLHADDSDICP